MCAAGDGFGAGFCAVFVRRFVVERSGKAWKRKAAIRPTVARPTCQRLRNKTGFGEESDLERRITEGEVGEGRPGERRG